MATKTVEKTSILTTNNFSTGLTLGAQAYKTIAQWNAPNINYDILNIKADYKDNQADSIELQAQEQANHLRNQFSEAVGSFKTGMARRNVKVGEGSGQMNIEDSAKELGADVSKMTGNAKFKAGMLRDQAEQYRAGAESSKEIAEWEKINNLFENISTMAGLFGKFKAEDVTEDVTEGSATSNKVGNKMPDKKQDAPIIDVMPELQTTLPIDVGEERRVSKSMERDDLVLSNETYSKEEMLGMSMKNKKKLLKKASRDNIFDSNNELVDYFENIGMGIDEIYAVLKGKA